MAGRGRGRGRGRPANNTNNSSESSRFVLGRRKVMDSNQESESDIRGGQIPLYKQAATQSQLNQEKLENLNRLVEEKRACDNFKSKKWLEKKAAQ